MITPADSGLHFIT